MLVIRGYFVQVLYISVAVYLTFKRSGSQTQPLSLVNKEQQHEPVSTKAYILLVMFKYFFCLFFYCLSIDLRLSEKRFQV